MSKLGVGYNSISNTLHHLSMIEISTAATSQETLTSPSAAAAKSTESDSYGYAAHTSFHLVSKTESFSKAFSAALSLNVPLPHGAVAIGVDMARTQIIEENSTYLVCFITIQKNRATLPQSAQLKSDTMEEIASSDFGDIMRFHGDTYVYEEIFGSAYCLVLDVMENSEALIQTLKATGAVKAQDIAAMKAAIANTKIFNKKSGEITGMIFGTGLPKDPGLPIVSTQIKIEDVPKEIKRIADILIQSPEADSLGYLAAPLYDIAGLTMPNKQKLAHLQQSVLDTKDVLQILHEQVVNTTEYIEAIEYYQLRFNQPNVKSSLPAVSQQIATSKDNLKQCETCLLENIRRIETGSLAVIENASTFLAELLELDSFAFLASLSGSTLREKMRSFKNELTPLITEIDHHYQPITLRHGSSVSRCSQYFRLNELQPGLVSFQLCAQESADEKSIRTLLSIITINLMSKGILYGNNIVFTDILAPTWFPLESKTLITSKQCCYFLPSSSCPPPIEHNYALGIKIYWRSFPGPKSTLPLAPGQSHELPEEPSLAISTGQEYDAAYAESLFDDTLEPSEEKARNQAELDLCSLQVILKIATGSTFQRLPVNAPPAAAAALPTTEITTNDKTAQKLTS